ncbi:hypothetical protein FRD01_02555 [Microvenator marinus]|uniref:Uncharacterized protein n=1 Tax=Microvenator marinus TaxID=2600177 RepID=A0A5B8XM36_9DELT|nr:hypothetical protein [Microvenator marinus]QED26157.1 hypothetical protein FRD01_02555 [Microvenator marinus]
MRKIEDVLNDDALPILSGDIADGQTLQRLIEQSLKMDAQEFHTWVQGYAEVYCQDSTIKTL